MCKGGSFTSMCSFSIKMKLLKFIFSRLFQNTVNMPRAEVIERFNANVGYSGLIYSVSQDVRDSQLFSFLVLHLYCIMHLGKY